MNIRLQPSLLKKLTLTLAASSCFYTQIAISSETEKAALNPLHPGEISLGYIHERGLKDVVPDSLVQLQSSHNYFSKFAFIVDKSVRSLSIWQQNNDKWTRVGHYPTDMGKKSGDKTITGDHRTPEGIYSLIDRYEGSSLDYKLYGSRAFATDYPNLYDRREGKTGSGIWLHAVPDTTPLTRGSRGCVVVRDKIIKDVTEFVDLKKTPIIIQEAVTYLPADEWKKKNQRFTRWIENWRSAWKSGDIESYMNFYSPEEFKSRGMAWKQWKNYKTRVFASSKSSSKKVNIKLIDTVIYSHKSEAVIKFIQQYQSNLVNDLGEKTLYLRKDKNSQWKIIAEHWKRLPSAIRRNLASYMISAQNN